MFGRVIIDHIKMNIRSPRYIFWTLAFPLGLGTLFFFAFSSIYSSETSSPIPVVYEVSDDAIQEYKIMQAFSNLDQEKINEDMEQFYTDQATAEAMGQSFTDEEPVSQDTLDALGEVQCYDDMKEFDMDIFPFEYLTTDRSEIDNISQEDLPFISMMEDLEYDNGTKMIEVVEVSSHDEAEKLLSDGDIAAIISVDSIKDVSMLVNGNGVKHSILSTIISEYRLQVGKAIDTINTDPEKLNESDAVMDESVDSMEFVNATSTAGENKDPYVSYFYNLIAMVALMGSMSSLNVIVNNQANQSTTGIRLDCSPIAKAGYSLAQLVAVTILQIMIQTIMLVYLIFILKIQFGGDVGMIFLTTYLASLVGVSLGFLVASIGKMKRDKKEAILMVFFLGGGFMSGLMYGDMKIIMEQKCPLFNRINPSSVITDAFYALNVFGVGERFYRSIIYMIVVSSVMVIAGCVLSRRSSYKSL